MTEDGVVTRPSMTLTANVLEWSISVLAMGPVSDMMVPEKAAVYFGPDAESVLGDNVAGSALMPG